MHPLDDITIYYRGNKIKQTPEDWTFRREANYITDFYHNSMNGYKPPKTGRICIHLNEEFGYELPTYFGCICSVYTEIDEELYLSLQQSERFELLLETVHQVLIDTAKKLNWNEAPFEVAYQNIKELDFVFRRIFPPKMTRNRLYEGTPILEKTIDRTKVIVAIRGEGISKELTLIDKPNMYWYDIAYKLVKQLKWFNRTMFGYHPKNGLSHSYYSIESDQVVSNLEFDKVGRMLRTVND